MRKQLYYRGNSHKQKGAALFVSLIFLLILTIIAVSSMDNTILDSKIVINHQDKQYSILMADTAVREPEVDLQNKQKRLDLEYDLCSDTTTQCTKSRLWSKDNLDWTASNVSGWWGDPSADDWQDLPVAYGTNGTNTYCAGKPNEKKYDNLPQSIDDGNVFNNCLANVAMPPTYIIEESSGGDGSSEIRSLEVSTGGNSTCSAKLNNYFWETTVQSSGARDTTRSIIRGTYVKKC